MSEIKVTTQGRDFLFNGVPTKIKARTSFGIIARLVRGEDELVDGWFKRVKAQGFNVVRVFGETDEWDGPFFSRHRTSPSIWPNRVTGSALHVSDLNKSVIRRLVDLLVKYDLVAEYCVVATLKGEWTEDEEYGTGVVTHILRATAEFLYEEGLTNLLPEAINEKGVHAFGEPLALQIPAIARRWRVRDYPGSLLGISNGGQWEVDYNTGSCETCYSHMCIHPPRREPWDIPHAVEADVPIYFNETIHYMTQAQWDEWVPQIPKWAGISTTEHERLFRWLTGLSDSYCVHDWNGMESDPRLPESPLETLFRGDSPPPPPVGKGECRHLVTQAYREVLLREPDISGLSHYNQLMVQGLLSEERLRDVLLRSEEFKSRFLG